MSDRERQALEAMEKLAGDITTLVQSFLTEHSSALDQDQVEAWQDVVDIADEQLMVVEEYTLD